LIVTSMPEILTRWQRFEQLSAGELYELLQFRQSIFVVEQASPYPDLDALDQQAWHLQLRADGALAGYLRLIAIPGPPPIVRFGRVALALDLRRRGLGRRLIEEALRFAGERYPERDAELAAQSYLVPFYRSFGFTIASDPYDDFGVAHVDMRMPRGATQTADP
jgi:ElaA protein